MVADDSGCTSSSTTPSSHSDFSCSPHDCHADQLAEEARQESLRFLADLTVRSRVLDSRKRPRFSLFPARPSRVLSDGVLPLARRMPPANKRRFVRKLRRLCLRKPPRSW